MQPGVTVVLATVWLVVYANAVGTAGLHSSRLILDQYSPLVPHHRQHGVYGRVEDQLDWKDQNPAEYQPFDLSIGPRGSISNSDTVSQERTQGNKYPESEPFHRRRSEYNDNFSPLVKDKQPGNSGSHEFTDARAKGGTKSTESSQRVPSPPSENPFVVDDTFQDQGPGSVEIYKLDLLEKSLLNPTPIARFPFKSKAPKKTGHANWKSKTVEYKATSPRIFQHKQSNTVPTRFDDTSTEIPANTDPFSIGGVPELQVGCEGLEASYHSKEKRSIDTHRDKKPKELDPWSDVTPISLDLDYELSGEEGYEEMDELFKLKKLETTTKKQNRGDMDASHLHFQEDKSHNEKLPVRGDLGKSSVNDSTVLSKFDQRMEEKSLHFNKEERDVWDTKPADGPASKGANQRKILWFDNSHGNERRGKRSVWGFGEDEGVVSSDELHTENERRRHAYEKSLKEAEEKRRLEEERRRREDAQKRSYTENRTNSDIEKIRDEYEQSLRQEEERRRRIEAQRQETEQRRRLQDEESRRDRLREEEHRRRELESRRRHQTWPPTAQHENRDEVKTGEENHLREEERRRRLQGAEEARRIELNKLEQMRREQEEQGKRDLEERRRHWMEKQRQVEEERRQRDRNEPSNLLYPTQATVTNEDRSCEGIERQIQALRQQAEAHRRELDILNARPRYDSSIDRDEKLRRLQEKLRRIHKEIKLHEYIRRNQPGCVPVANVITGAVPDSRSRYPGPGSGRRNHGPSAPTNIDPRVNAYDRQTEQRRRLDEESRRDRSRNEEQRRRELESRGRYQPWPQTAQLENRRQLEEDEIKMREENRLREQERQRRLQEAEEARRRELSKWEEINRKHEEQGRRNLDERRHWMEKQRQRDRDEPSNLSYPTQATFTNDNRSCGDMEKQIRALEQQAQAHQRELDILNARSRYDSSIDPELRTLQEKLRKVRKEIKLNEYIRRNEPACMPKANVATEVVPYNRSRYPGPGSGRRNHGPSAPTNIDPRGDVYDTRAREAARRRFEDTRIREQQEQLRKEALRREEEFRRTQSRIYEENRRRLEAERRANEQAARNKSPATRPSSVSTRTRHDEHRRVEEHDRRQDTSLIPANLVSNESRRAMDLAKQRQALEGQRLRDERQRQENSRQVMDYDRGKSASLAPASLVLNDSSKIMDLAKQRKELEGTKLRNERRRQENRVQVTGRQEQQDRIWKEQRRRKEEERLKKLPVSSVIVVRPQPSPWRRPTHRPPVRRPPESVQPRIDNNVGPPYDFVFPDSPIYNGYYNPALQIPNQLSSRPPAPTQPVIPILRPQHTPKAPGKATVASPKPCVWAVVSCCSSNTRRLVTCFESLGCPNVGFQSNPCTGSIVQAARDEVEKFYAANEEDDYNN